VWGAGPMVHRLLSSFLVDVDWGRDLDYLNLRPLPAGHGDVQLCSRSSSDPNGPDR